MERQRLTIFLSHSHKDIEKVRKIRDILETLEMEPIIFFLKCLDDNNEDLEEFIKAEIKARNIFLYCKSQNAVNSKWVQKELEYIKSLPNARIYEVDIDGDFSSSVVKFIVQCSKILKRNRFYITHSYYDNGAANSISEYLNSCGFGCLTARDTPLGADYLSFIYSAIDEVAEEGFLIYLISEKSLQARHVVYELQYAVKKGCNIVPIIISENEKEISQYDLPSAIKLLLPDINPVVMSPNPSQLQLDKLLDLIKRESQ